MFCVCVWVYVWWNWNAWQLNLCSCFAADWTRKRTHRVRKKFQEFFFFPLQILEKKQTRSITSFHFVSFANLCKKLKRKNTKTHTHIQKKVEETQEKTDVNLYLNGAILIFISYVCVWIFTTFVESSKKRPKKIYSAQAIYRLSIVF